MSSYVDERIVSMQFDNKEFESGVSRTLQSLEKLKEKLKFKTADAGMKTLQKAADTFHIDNMDEQLDKVSQKFNVLEIAGKQAIMTLSNNATNALLNFGKKLVDKYIVKPVADGFHEYELMQDTIQSIYSTTKAKGTTIQEIEAGLDELNTYADNTVYSMSDMTTAISQFTNAGVGFGTAKTAVKGFANLAAAVGATNAELSRVEYQASQAMNSGVFKLMDWNSIQNSALGGEFFRNKLLENAAAMTKAGAEVKRQIESGAVSFRDSLQKEWLTSDIFIKTLEEFADDAEMMAAATQVRTFSKLKETLEEAAGSGWSETWRLIVGDFTESKALFADVANGLGSILDGLSDARNSVLHFWKDSGGRDALVGGLKNVIDILLQLTRPIKEAFDRVLQPFLAKRLTGLTESFEKLSGKMLLSDNAQRGIQAVFEVIFTAAKMVLWVFDKVAKVVGTVAVVVGKVFGGVLSAVGLVAKGVDFVTGKVASLFKGAKKTKSGVTKPVQEAAEGVKDAAEKAGEGADGMKEAADTVTGATQEIDDADADGVLGRLSAGWSTLYAAVSSRIPNFDAVKEKIKSILDSLGLLDNVQQIVSRTQDAMQKFGSVASKVGGAVKKTGKQIVSEFGETVLTKIDGVVQKVQRYADVFKLAYERLGPAEFIKTLVTEGFNSFTDFIDRAKGLKGDFQDSLGFMLDWTKASGSKEMFSMVFENLNNKLVKAVPTIGKVEEHLKDLYTRLLDNEYFNKFAQNSKEFAQASIFEPIDYFLRLKETDSTGDALKHAATLMLNNIGDLTFLPDQLGTKLSKLTEKFKGSKIFAGISQWAQSLPDSLLQAAGTVKNVIKEDILSFVDNLNDPEKKAERLERFSSFVQSLSDIGQSAIGIVRGLTGLLQPLWEAIAKLGTKMSEVLNDPVIRENLSTALGQAVELFSSAFSFATKGFSSAFKKVTEFLTAVKANPETARLIENLKTLVKKIFGGLKELGKSFVEMANSGLEWMNSLNAGSLAGSFSFSGIFEKLFGGKKGGSEPAKAAESAAQTAQDVTEAAEQAGKASVAVAGMSTGMSRAVAGLSAAPTSMVGFLSTGKVMSDTGEIVQDLDEGDEILQRYQGFVDHYMSTYESYKNAEPTEKKWKNPLSFLTQLTEGMDLKGMLKSGGIAAVITAITTRSLSLSKLIRASSTATKSIGKWPKTIQRMTKSVSKAIGSFNDFLGLKAMAKAKKVEAVASVIKGIAFGVLAIVGAIAAIAYIAKDKEHFNFTAGLIVVGGIVAAIAILTKMLGGKELEGAEDAFKMILSVAGVIYVAALAISKMAKVFSEVGGGAAAAAIMALVVVFTGIAALFAVARDSKGGDEWKGIAAVGHAVYTLTKGVAKIAKNDPKSIVAAGVVVALVIFAMQKMMEAASKLGNVQAEKFEQFSRAVRAIGTAVLLVSFGVLILITAALKIAKALQKAESAGGVAAVLGSIVIVAGLVTGMAFLTRMLSKHIQTAANVRGIIASAAAMILMAFAVKMLVPSIMALALVAQKMPGGFTAAVATVGLIFGAYALMIRQFSKYKIDDIGAVFALAASMLIFSLAIQMIAPAIAMIAIVAQKAPKGFALALVLLAGLAGITAMMALLAKHMDIKSVIAVAAVAASFVAVAVGFEIFSKAMRRLGKITGIERAMKSLWTLVLVFGIVMLLGAAVALFPPLAAGIAVAVAAFDLLAVGVLIFGIAVEKFGEGIEAFAKGVRKLANISSKDVDKIGDNLIRFFDRMDEILAHLAAAFVSGIMIFAKAIWDARAGISKAIGGVVMVLLDAIFPPGLGSRIGTKVLDVLDEAITWLNDNSERIQAIASKLSYLLLETVSRALAGLMEGLSTAFTGLLSYMAENNPALYTLLLPFAKYASEFGKYADFFKYQADFYRDAIDDIEESTQQANDAVDNFNPGNAEDNVQGFVASMGKAAGKLSPGGRIYPAFMNFSTALDNGAESGRNFNNAMGGFSLEPAGAQVTLLATVLAATAGDMSPGGKYYNAFAAFPAAVGRAMANNAGRAKFGGVAIAQSVIGGFDSTAYPLAMKAGVHVVQGLALGLQDPQERANLRAVAVKLGEDTVTEDLGHTGMGSASPSRKAIAIGGYTVLGLALGLQDPQERANLRAVAVKLGSSVIQSIDAAMRNTSSTPSITPVIKSGTAQAQARKIGSLFEQSRSMSVTTTAKLAHQDADVMRTAADDMRRMSTYNDSKVVSAITTLNREIGRMHGTIGQMSERIDGMQVTLDGRKLVGALSRPMDRRLGQMEAHSRKG